MSRSLFVMEIIREVKSHHQFAKLDFVSAAEFRSAAVEVEQSSSSSPKKHYSTITSDAMYADINCMGKNSNQNTAIVCR